MSNGPKFCSNCGEKLDALQDIKECPKCHSALHEHSEHVESTPSVVKTLPYKSPGTAALVAFIGGLFALPGIGHIYVGKIGRGIGILILGLILYAVTVIMIMTMGIVASVGQTNPEVVSDNSAGIAAIGIMLVLIIVYIIFFIWQIFNARKLAKKFNDTVNTTGKEPW